MPAGSPEITDRKGFSRSRIGNGSALFPTVDGRSIWARLFRDTYSAVIAHCGGADAVSELERIDARRIAGLEAELVHLENNFALARAEGAEPSANALDLYARLANSQRRLSEALGWQRRPRDVTPNASLYLDGHSEAAE
jgi:hypothetical protein